MNRLRLMKKKLIFTQIVHIKRRMLFKNFYTKMYTVNLSVKYLMLYNCAGTFTKSIYPPLTRRVHSHRCSRNAEPGRSVPSLCNVICKRYSLPQI